MCTVQGCGKRFTEYSSLYKHHVVHTHTKPYTCHCGKTYRQTSTLAMHKRTAHGEDVPAGILLASQEPGISFILRPFSHLNCGAPKAVISCTISPATTIICLFSPGFCSSDIVFISLLCFSVCLNILSI